MADIKFLYLGLFSGVIGGLVGIGGGIIVVPSLILLFGFSQQLSQGTTLAALVPPVGLLAAYVYYKNGNINIPAALWISLGLFIGAFFGAKIANQLSREHLQKVFGVLLLLIGVKFVFFKI